jgi:hypothetical protein
MCCEGSTGLQKKDICQGTPLQCYARPLECGIGMLQCCGLMVQDRLTVIAVAAGW